MFNHTRSWLTPQPKKTCSTCGWYTSGADPICRGLAHLKICQCPKMVYEHRRVLEADECIVAVDAEGRGFSPGPDFGCIHHEEKSV